MLNALLTDFYGKLITKKWAVMTKCSIDTALWDINDLIEKGVLQKSEVSGRSMSYEMACDKTHWGFGFYYFLLS